MILGHSNTVQKTPVNVLTKICILSWPFEYIYILSAVFRTRNRSGVFLRTRPIGKGSCCVDEYAL